jgi:hypothetical protein
MVRFSNASLSTTQYIVTGITPIAGSTTAIVPQIPPSFTTAREVPPVSSFVSGKTVCGVSSTVSDLTAPGEPDPNVDLGLLYSNGYRYQYIDFQAGTTACSIELPDKVVTVQVQTDSGPIYVDETLSGYTLVTAYVGNRIVVPSQGNDVVTNTMRPPSKLPPQLTNNNNC